MASEEKIFFILCIYFIIIYLSTKISFSVVMETIKIRNLDKIHMVGIELLRKLFYKSFVKIS